MVLRHLGESELSVFIFPSDKLTILLYGISGKKLHDVKKGCDPLKGSHPLYSEGYLINFILRG